MKAQIRKVDNGRMDFYFDQNNSGEQSWDVEVDGGNVQVRAESIRVDLGNGNYVRRETGNLTVHRCPDGRASDYDTITPEMAQAAISAVRNWQANR